MAHGYRLIGLPSSMPSAISHQPSQPVHPARSAIIGSTVVARQAAHAERKADDDEQQSLTKHHRQNGVAARTERHTHAELLRRCATEVAMTPVMPVIVTTSASACATISAL